MWAVQDMIYIVIFVCVKFMDLPLLCNVFTWGSSVHINLFFSKNLHFSPYSAFEFIEVERGQMTCAVLQDESLSEPREPRILLAPSLLYH